MNTKEMHEQAAQVLLSAIRSSPVEACLAILSAESFRKEVDRLGLSGNNALHVATWRNHLGIVKEILNAGADPNITDEESGWSSVHKAFYFGNIRVAGLLLGARGDAVHVTDGQGRSPVDVLSQQLKDVCKVYESHGHVFAWGNGSNFTLGTGSMDIQLVPSRVEALHDQDAVQVAAAKFHSAVVTDDGKLFTWGWGLGGRLGHPEAHIHSGNSAVIQPRLVSSLSRVHVSRIAVAKHHTLLCTSQGELFSMGSNRFGQLGYPSGDTQPEPRKVTALRSMAIVRIAAANKHSVAISSTGDVFTWGSNSCGQLGYGAFDSSSSSNPRVVEALKGKFIAECAAAKRHCVVLTKDGDILTWGHRGVSPRKVVLAGVRLQNARGSDGSVLRFHKGYIDVSKPLVESICAGAAHSSALTSTGVVLTWRSADPALQVQEIGGNLAGKKVVSIAAGKYRTAAVTDDGDVYVWEGRADFFPAEGRAAGSGSKKSRGQGIKGQWNGDHVLGSSAGSSSSSYERGGSYRSESPSLMERMHHFRLSKMGSSPSPRISASIMSDYQVLEGRFDAICPMKVKGPKKVADVAVGEKHSLALQSWFKDTAENGNPYPDDMESSNLEVTIGKGPQPLQCICEESIAKHMVDPHTALQVMMYADAAGARILCERCASVAALNLDAILIEHPTVLSQMPAHLLEYLEQKIKVLFQMEENGIDNPDMILLTPLEHGACPTRAPAILGDLDTTYEEKTEEGTVPDDASEIRYNAESQFVSSRAFRGPSHDSETESCEEGRRLRRLILKKIQQCNALEERLEKGEHLDTQQKEKLYQKKVVISALVALDSGVPHEQVNALLRAASQAVVESQLNLGTSVQPPSLNRSSKGSTATKSKSKKKMRLKATNSAPDTDQRHDWSHLKEEKALESIKPGSAPIKQIGFSTDHDANTTLKNHGAKADSGKGFKTPARNSRKGGLSMFLRGELESPTATDKPAWGGKPSSQTSITPSPLSSLVSLKDETPKSDAGKLPKDQSSASKSGGSQRKLGVKVSLHDYLKGIVPTQDSPATEIQDASSPWALSEGSGANLPSLRTIQMEQEELKAASQRKIPCPSGSHRPIHDLLGTSPGSVNSTFQMVGQSPTRTGFFYGGSPSSRGMFVAAPRPTENKWYIREETAIAVARAKSLKSIQEEEHAMKELAKLYGNANEALGLHDRDRLLGLVFILLVSTIWVIASFLVQGIESAGIHPVVITFVSNSLFSIYFPVYWLGSFLKHQSSTNTDVSIDDNKIAPHRSAFRQFQEKIVGNQLFQAAAVVAPIWFLAQLTFNASLTKTSVTSNTILSSASALFTFGFAVVLLSERFTYLKLGFITMLMVGTAMVTISDAESTSAGEKASASVLGDALCLLSAVFYGMYTVSIRKQLKGDDETVPMTLFFAIMGSLIFLVIGSILAILFMSGVRFGTLSWSSLGIIILKGLLDNVLSDYLWARSILLLGPTLATSGLALQVPIAVILDAIFKDPGWLHSLSSGILTLLGGCIILVGFIGLNRTEEDTSGQSRDEDQIPLTRPS